MQQPKKLNRLFKALARQKLDVSYNNQTYSVRWQDRDDAPTAEVLLPDNFSVDVVARLGPILTFKA